MKSQKGIAGFLRKKQELGNKTEKNNVKTAGKKVKKKVKKIVNKSMLNKKVSKVKNMKEGMYIAYIFNVNYATIVSWVKGVGTSTCL